MKNSTPFLSNRMYDLLKWVATIALPAVGTFVATVGALTDWQYTELTVGIILATGLLIGSLIGVSSRQYKNAGLADPPQVGVINVIDKDDKLTYDMAVDMDPAELQNMAKVAFQINRDPNKDS